MFTSTSDNCSHGEQPVLFQIEIDTRLDTKPYSDIFHVSYFQDAEEEVLIMLGAIFKIHDVAFDDEEKIWVIKLTMCRDNDHELKHVFDSYKRDLEEANLVSLGKHLYHMNELDKAEVMFRRHLDIDSAEGGAYTGLGMIAYRKCEINSAIQYYERALELDAKRLLLQHPNTATNHLYIGNAYKDMGVFDTAFQHYSIALEIRLHIYGEHHIKVAAIYQNMGNLYDEKKDYPTSLEYKQKCLNIREKILPKMHPGLALICSSIGTTYSNMLNYETALMYAIKAHEIQKKSLPSYHVHLGISHNNIGYLNLMLNNNDEALKNLNIALSIDQVARSKKDPHFATTYQRIGMVHERKMEYPLALENYLQAKEILNSSNVSKSHVADVQEDVLRLREILKR
ncbi:unnamed protein product [Didymodactylos carnosus]|uniref:Uncharacterized protein n=1 Tax=Didymodactylos carnosus TaxID=1234261 RepID=A0A814UV09_9BILA|nr:unnamed protein product [Didymodactylos carnosus]CAF1467301.1 unnamed protein product [Didymodactylos carnosus]CAF3943050.1 unnamed protein product [Didymodactylos carnosus]CAF4259641.1 unnamed protein product [Didymodactylos carnosus]